MCFCDTVVQGAHAFTQTSVFERVQEQAHRMREGVGRHPKGTDPANVVVHHETLVVPKLENHRFVEHSHRAVQLLRQGQMGSATVARRRPFVEIVQQRRF